MQVIGLFAFFVIALTAVGIGICSIVENYSPHISLLAFLGLIVVNVVIAWKLALYLTERFLLTDAQRQAMEHQMKVVRGLIRP